MRVLRTAGAYYVVYNAGINKWERKRMNEKSNLICGGKWINLALRNSFSGHFLLPANTAHHIPPVAERPRSFEIISMEERKISETRCLSFPCIWICGLLLIRCFAHRASFHIFEISGFTLMFILLLLLLHRLLFRFSPKNFKISAHTRSHTVDKFSL